MNGNLNIRPATESDLLVLLDIQKTAVMRCKLFSQNSFEGGRDEEGRFC